LDYDKIALKDASIEEIEQKRWTCNLLTYIFGGIVFILGLTSLIISMSAKDKDVRRGFFYLALIIAGGLTLILSIIVFSISMNLK